MSSVVLLYSGKHGLYINEGQKGENSQQPIFKMLLGKLTKTKEAFVQLLKKLGFVM